MCASFVLQAPGSACFKQLRILLRAHRRERGPSRADLGWCKSPASIPDERLLGQLPHAQRRHLQARAATSGLVALPSQYSSIAMHWRCAVPLLLLARLLPQAAHRDRRPRVAREARALAAQACALVLGSALGALGRLVWSRPSSSVSFSVSGSFDSHASIASSHSSPSSVRTTTRPRSPCSDTWRSPIWPNRYSDWRGASSERSASSFVRHVRPPASRARSASCAPKKTVGRHQPVDPLVRAKVVVVGEVVPETLARLGQVLGLGAVPQLLGHRLPQPLALAQRLGVVRARHDVPDALAVEQLVEGALAPPGEWYWRPWSVKTSSGLPKRAMPSSRHSWTISVFWCVHSDQAVDVAAAVVEEDHEVDTHGCGASARSS